MCRGEACLPGPNNEHILLSKSVIQCFQRGPQLNRTVKSSVILSSFVLAAMATGANPMRSISLKSISIKPSSILGSKTASGVIELSGVAPKGGVSVQLSSNQPAASVPSSVEVAAGSSSATFKVETSPVSQSTMATVTGSLGTGTETALVTIVPPDLDSLSLKPTAISGSEPSIGTVTLTGPAPVGGMLINVSTSQGQANLPNTITVPAGMTSAQFVITAPVSNGRSSVGIYVSSNDAFRIKNLTLESGEVTSVSLAPATILGGGSSLATVTLNGIAGPGGAAVYLKSLNQVAVASAEFFIPAGQSSGSAPVYTVATRTNSDGNIVATFGTSSKGTPLKVLAPTIQSITFAPSPVIGGTTTVCTITLTGQSPVNSLLVSLTSSSPSATVPAYAIVQMGTTSVTFQVSTKAVTSAISAKITAKMENVASSAILAIEPPSPQEAYSRR